MALDSKQVSLRLKQEHMDHLAKKGRWHTRYIQQLIERDMVADGTEPTGVSFGNWRVDIDGTDKDGNLILQVSHIGFFNGQISCYQRNKKKHEPLKVEVSLKP